MLYLLFLQHRCPVRALVHAVLGPGRALTMSIHLERKALNQMPVTPTTVELEPSQLARGKTPWHKETYRRG